MAKVNVLNLENKVIGSVELNQEVFEAKVNVPLVHQVIKAQLAAARQGTAKTKTKAEVRGGGKKPFRQKGTGNARQGSIRSPLQPGGGQSFGPQPRCYVQDTPKEMIRGAIRSVLSDRLKSNRLIVVEDFALESIKTQKVAQVLKNSLKVDSVLVVDLENDTLMLSARNLPKVKVLHANALNVYDVVHKQWLVMTRGAVESIQNRLQS